VVVSAVWVVDGCRVVVITGDTVVVTVPVTCGVILTDDGAELVHPADRIAAMTRMLAIIMIGDRLI